MDYLIGFLAMVIGYLAGSISFARLVTRLFAPGQSINKIELEVPGSEARFESDAISATSVRLHLGSKYGCLTSILDILKATIPALAFKLWQPEAPYYLLAAGMAAVGHNWPIYYRFKGGRGMSPIMGGMLVVDWPGVVITNLLGLLSDLVIKSTLVSSGVWLVLMIPWIWFRSRDGAELIYVTAMCTLFWGSMIPEWRELLRLRREGVLENLQQAKEVRVISRRDGGTVQQMSVSDLLSAVVSRLRKDANRVPDSTMHPQKRTLAWIVLSGGTAVLVSYAYVLSLDAATQRALWGGVPEALLPMYVTSMALATAGYLAFTSFLLFRVDPNKGQGAGRFGYGPFHVFYLMILVPSALWLPLTATMVEQPSSFLWLAIWLVLGLVGLGSVGLLLALLAWRPRQPARAYWLAVAGSVAFCLQTAVLDLFVWTAHFPVQGVSLL